MKLHNKVLIFIIAISLFFCSTIKAEERKNLVNIYFFHSNTCSHCQSEEKLLNKLEKEYDNIRVYRYEVSDSNNNEIKDKVRDLFNLKTNGVPITIIGETPYIGYLEEVSTLTFKKTIEYYSRYGYTDKVGQLLEIELLPNYKPNKNNPSLEEFIDTYENYKLIGNITTNDFDLTSNAIILGLLSKLNILNIISLILVLILLTKIDSSKNKILLLMFYLITSFLYTTTYLINNNIYTLIIEIISLLIFMFCLLRYTKNKGKLYIYSNIFIIIAILINYLEHTFIKDYSKILRNLINLNSIEGINILIYYIYYLFVIILINIILVLLIYKLIKIINKAHQKH